jgi:hypothetical protein
MIILIMIGSETARFQERSSLKGVLTKNWLVRAGLQPNTKSSGIAISIGIFKIILIIIGSETEWFQER